MRPSFLDLERPVLAVMIEQGSEAGIIGGIKRAGHDGARAFAVDLSMPDDSCRQAETIRRIVDCTTDPVLLYSYRTYQLIGHSDDEIAQLQLRCAENGASCCDVMGDLFDPSPYELTRDATAVKKQTDLIRAIHDAGAQALISSHILEHRSSAQVLEQMERMVDRGVDVAKVIIFSNTQEEFTESIETLQLLKEKLPVPFIFLNSGKYGRMFRYIAPMLGSLVTFSVPEYNERSHGPQPITSELRTFYDDMTRHMRLY